MINKRFTILSTDINSKTANVLDVELTKVITSPIGETDTRYLYPLEIQIINDCGAGVEWLLISSVEEYAEYINSPSSFTFIRLPQDSILQENFNSLGRCYKFIIKGYETTATESLIVEFINYKPSLK
jgi:hypothetical protein